MTPAPSEFRQTILLAAQGSEEAFKVLVERYGGHVQRIVRHKLSRRLQTKVDEDDLQQMVWASFFNHRSRVVAFEESQAMVRYLVGIAANKVKTETARYLAEKRSIEREEAIDEPAVGLTASTETPSQVAIRTEEINAVIEGLSPRDQAIMQRWLVGAKYPEIARELGLDESTVGKIIRRVFHRKAQVEKE